MSDARPVAVFDSGLGGLTVAAELRRQFPAENLVFLADRARVPYASLSQALITRFALECLDFMLEHDPKAVVIGCNTVSAVCLDEIRARSHVPVIGVIEPTASAAAAATKTKRIGVLATTSTVKRRAYDTRFAELIAGVQVFSNGCPLLVPLVEEGWTDGEIPRRIIEHYAEPVLREGVDTLVLGCTHYEYFRDTLQEVFGPAVTLINTPEVTARDLQPVVREHAEPRTGERADTVICSTDVNDALQRVVSDLFAKDIQAGRLQVRAVQIPSPTASERR
ncbi:glutamate racemase [candidate division KSB1 bacterium]|nr:glutamate racemase [candidate division KSB1 bacterium]